MSEQPPQEVDFEDFCNKWDAFLAANPELPSAFQGITSLVEDWDKAINLSDHAFIFASQGCVCDIRFPSKESESFSFCIIQDLRNDDSLFLETKAADIAVEVLSRFDLSDLLQDELSGPYKIYRESDKSDRYNLIWKPTKTRRYRISVLYEGPPSIVFKFEAKAGRNSADSEKITEVDHQYVDYLSAKRKLILYFLRKVGLEAEYEQDVQGFEPKEGKLNLAQPTKKSQMSDLFMWELGGGERLAASFIDTNLIGISVRISSTLDLLDEDQLNLLAVNYQSLAKQRIHALADLRLRPLRELIRAVDWMSVDNNPYLLKAEGYFHQLRMAFYYSISPAQEYIDVEIFPYEA